LAEELHKRFARPDTDGDDGFADRSLHLDTTFGGAGKLDGNLTPHCTAAMQAVLDALGKRRGPEDLRTKGQRLHDALDDACRRLIGSGCLPAWAGAATAGPGDDCDAQIVPVVTGRVDPDVLDRLAATLLDDSPPHPAAATPATPDQPAPATPATPDQPAFATPASPDQPGPATPASPDQPGPATPLSPDQPGPATPASPDQPGDTDAARRARAERAARQMILAAAADLLSGPGGLAAYLRTRLAPGTVASVSLPLDVGAVTETIPVHLRRAVAVRDRGCRFPGCDQPVPACQPHHIPRAQGGPTSLTNLLELCAFHHLIAVHRWGWAIVLHPDGTVTATSPDGSKTLHSHGPPPAAAA
jgi:hypothetical protein